MAVSVVRQPCTVCVLNTLLAVPIQLDRWYVRCSEAEGSLVETSASGQPRCFAFWQEFSKVSLPLPVHSAPLVLIIRLAWNSAMPTRTSRVTAVRSRTTTLSVYTTRRRCVSHPVFPTSIALTAACPFLLCTPCGPHQPRLPPRPPSLHLPRRARALANCTALVRFPPADCPSEGRQGRVRSPGGACFQGRAQGGRYPCGGCYRWRRPYPTGQELIVVGACSGSLGEDVSYCGVVATATLLGNLDGFTARLHA
jgi:hypothetical protein